MIEVRSIESSIELVASSSFFSIEINFIAIDQFLDIFVHIIVVERVTITISIVVDNHFTSMVNLPKFSSKTPNIKNFVESQSVHLWVFMLVNVIKYKIRINPKAFVAKQFLRFQSYLLS